VTVTEPRVGIRDLEITGVGPLTSGAEEVPGASIAEDAWDDKFMTYYTGADAAAISPTSPPSCRSKTCQSRRRRTGLSSARVPILSFVTRPFRGNERWEDGFAGIMAFRSPGVIEETTLVDGRDSIYAYRSEGIVVRENEIAGSLLGST